MNLTQAEIGKEYIVKEIQTKSEAMSKFLFTLGCFAGEKITLVSLLSSTYVVVIKDGRYSIDKNLAKAICI